MPATTLSHLTIGEAGARLAARSLSALDLVEAILQRIEETEPLIHAYTVVLAEQARAAARELDRELAGGRRRGPLHGIPIGVKDLCATRGIPTEAGSRVLSGYTPNHDAAVVDRLREAGAILIGKTVTHEFAYGLNEPPTRNAWHPAYYPGGSSAGSGAAVAARSAFGAIGTDTGGSIREPATLNGVVGLKPTFGLVSRFGITPLSSSLDHAGPLARTVEDCALLLQAIAGYDPRDTGSIAAPAVDYTADLDQGVEGLIVGVERRHFLGDQVWSEVRAAVEAVVKELERLGARIVEVELPNLDLMSTVGVTILLADASAYHRRTLREHPHELDPATRVMFELGELLPATHYVTAQRVRAVLRDQTRALFTAHHLDALISPTSPTTSVPVDLAMQTGEDGQDPFTAALQFMIPANLTGQPALSVPCGFSAAGLPIGFQLLGRPFGEPTLFRLARAYEREHRWAEAVPAISQGGASHA